VVHEVLTPRSKGEGSTAAPEPTSIAARTLPGRLARGGKPREACRRRHVTEQLQHPGRVSDCTRDNKCGEHRSEAPGQVELGRGARVEGAPREDDGRRPYRPRGHEGQRKEGRQLMLPYRRHVGSRTSVPKFPILGRTALFTSVPLLISESSFLNIRSEFMGVYCPQSLLPG
jgi:hypothetical protein